MNAIDVSEAQELLLQSPNILGDHVCHSIMVKLPPGDAQMYEELAGHLLNGEYNEQEYASWNMTSIGNLLLIWRTHADNALGQAAAEALRGYLQYVDRTGDQGVVEGRAHRGGEAADRDLQQVFSALPTV